MISNQLTYYNNSLPAAEPEERFIVDPETSGQQEIVLREKEAPKKEQRTSVHSEKARFDDFNNSSAGMTAGSTTKKKKKKKKGKHRRQSNSSSTTSGGNEKLYRSEPAFDLSPEPLFAADSLSDRFGQSLEYLPAMFGANRNLKYTPPAPQQEWLNFAGRSTTTTTTTNPVSFAKKREEPYKTKKQPAVSPYNRTMATFDAMFVTQQEVLASVEGPSKERHGDMFRDETVSPQDAKVKAKIPKKTGISDELIYQSSEGTDTLMKHAAGNGHQPPVADISEETWQTFSPFDEGSALTYPDFTQEKLTMMDDFASFAETSLDSYVNTIAPASLPIPRTVGPVSQNGEAVPHDMLVSYLLSMGTRREVAENLSFAFLAQQRAQQNQLSASTRSVEARVPTLSSPMARTMPMSRSATASKMDYVQRYAGEPRRASTGDAPISLDTNCHISSTVPIVSARAGNGGLESEELTSSRRPRTRRVLHQRADAPGAVEMEGRAFGAPPRPRIIPTRSNTRTSAPRANPREASSRDVLVEAMTVEEGKPAFVAVAERVSLKHILKQRPVRAMVCAAVVLLAGAAAIVCYVLFSRPKGGNSSLDPIETVAPSVSPTFVSDELLQAAANFSGWEVFNDSDSPQFKAIAWLSTYDEMDQEDFGPSFLQRYVLTTFFYSTKGEEWLDKGNWLNPRLSECSWSDGVFCRREISNQLVVFGIDETRNGLGGTLPHELGMMQSLEFIRMPTNKVYGTIPPSIFNLKQLEVLDVGSNALNGEIPPNIGNASLMQSISLYGNDLSGLMPPGLFDLTLLREIDLHTNKISGKIPDDIAKLSSLISLDLRSNLLSGTFPSFRGNPVLDFIHLDYNRLTGAVPPISASVLRRLEVSVSYNFISGTIPEGGGDEPIDVNNIRLRLIDYSYNLISGTTRRNMALLPSLQYLDYSGNFLTGTFSDIPVWRSLKHIAYADNLLTGPLPYQFQSILSHYDFSGNDLTGDIPTGLCQLPQLNAMIASGNQLEGSIPECVNELSKLRDLELASDNLNGTIPSRLSQLSQLVILDLSNNNLSGALPSQFGLLTALNDLNLSDNLFDGTLPVQLGNLGQTANHIYLENNALVGTIPSSLARLTKLENLTLSGNAFEGSVPDELCRLSSLSLRAEDVGCFIECSCCGGTDAFCGDPAG